jgi:hypothetical protein
MLREVSAERVGNGANQRIRLRQIHRLEDAVSWPHESGRPSVDGNDSGNLPDEVAHGARVGGNRSRLTKSSMPRAAPSVRFINP